MAGDTAATVEATRLPPTSRVASLEDLEGVSLVTATSLGRASLLTTKDPAQERPHHFQQVLSNHTSCWPSQLSTMGHP